MDYIRIHGLELYGYHGVFPEENILGQRFKIDVELGISLRTAGTTDQLHDTINYAEACEQIKQIVEGKPFKLIEALAECIASKLLGSYTNIDEVKVHVVKVHPPVAMHLTGIEVEIHRKQVD